MSCSRAGGATTAIVGDTDSTGRAIKGPCRYVTWIGPKWHTRFVILVSVMIALMVAIGMIAFCAFALQGDALCAL